MDFSCFGYHPDLESRLTFQEKWVLAHGPLRNDGVETASKGLLAHLSLLFVPAGVGVVQELDLLASHGIAIILVLALSVVVTLLATVLTFRLVSRLLKQQDAR
ncbi:CidA/LrgA family protein [Bradyrhizobium liaoningense]